MCKYFKGARQIFLFETRGPHETSPPSTVSRTPKSSCARCWMAFTTTWTEWRSAWGRPSRTWTTTRKSEIRSSPIVCWSSAARLISPAVNPTYLHTLTINSSVEEILMCLTWSASCHRDEEKSKRMWNMYLAREDSKVVGGFISRP